jgi:hypothetical protein
LRMPSREGAAEAKAEAAAEVAAEAPRLCRTPCASARRLAAAR